MIHFQLAESLDPSSDPDLQAAAGAEGELLASAAAAALAYAGAAEPGRPDPASCALTIVLTDDVQLQALNRDYLGIDAPTDVLSFPADETDPESGERYLGDILISFPRAAAQARQGGHAVQDELRLLAVHGTLHLLGHDHAEAGERLAMWAAQAEILRRLGSAITAPAGDEG
jgi:probable rRNA maturation factor